MITTSENIASAGLCYNDGSDSSPYWNTTADGGLNIGLTNELWATIASDWGMEIITELSAGSNRGFVLPAKSGMIAQQYTIDNGAIDPNITAYSA